MKVAIVNALLLALLVVLLPKTSHPQCESENWDTRFFRPGQVIAVKVAASGGKVYVAGKFTEQYDMGGGNRGSRQLAGIITWDGAKWNYPSYENCLTGPASWTFNDIIVMGTDVVVAGSFTQTNGGDSTIEYVARWDGQQWWPLSRGVNDVVYCLATSGNLDVYAGGLFTEADTMPASHVAHWTLSGWQPLLDPSGTQQGTNNSVFAMTFFQNHLILGGSFTHVGSGIPANHLAAYNWTTGEWTDVGGGATTGVTLLTSGVEGLYVGEVIEVGDQVPISGIALWDGGSWSDIVTTNFSGFADINTWNGGDLIAVGSYLDNPPGTFNRHIARYNSVTSMWEDLLPSCNLDASPTDIALDGFDIYAVTSSSFGATYACGSAIGTVAWFNGTEWRGLGEGMTTNGAWGTALNISDTAVYVGGIFGHLGGVGVHNGIARWSQADEHWNPLTMDDISGLKKGSFDATVWDVEEISDSVYLVGEFTNAGSLATTNIVGWDGLSYFPLGGGTDVSSVVYTVEPFKGDIYVGGYIFTMKQPDNSTPSLGGFVRWNGSEYEKPDGSGLNFVMELEDAGDYMYIGGQFLSNGLVPTPNVVRYDGTVFDSVGGGVKGRVYDIETAGADVYVAGGFTTATNPDGTPINASRLARWNGDTWEAVGEFNDTVRAIYLRGGEIYAAGHFTSVDGVTARHVAYYDGSQWNALGEGTEGEITINNGEVFELGSDGDALWMTGRFAFANGLPSQNVARWTFCTPAPPTFAQGGTGAEVNGTTVTLSWDPEESKSVALATTYTVQVAEGNNFENIVEDVSGISGYSYEVGGLAPSTVYSWRVRADVDGAPGAWSVRQTFETSVGTAVGDDTESGLPTSFALGQSYPNPFNPTATIEYQLPHRAHVSLEVLNLLGQKVRTLVNETTLAGAHSVIWDGTSSSGETVASGVYFYRIVADDFLDTKKMLLLK